MNLPTSTSGAGTSTRPYLIRALHDWCTDNGFTPYVAVFVDASVQVPTEYVKNNEIVLNIGFEATTALKLGNEAIEFKARFGGTSRDIMVPIDHVIAIYARENGQGMAFPVPTDAAEASAAMAGLDSVPSEQAAPAISAAKAPKLTLTDVTAPATDPVRGADVGETPPEPPGGGRPTLKRVK